MDDAGGCLNISEIRALLEAAQRPGGWALVKRKTTGKVAGRGWLEPAEPPLHGPGFRITAAGPAVLARQSGRRARGVVRRSTAIAANPRAPKTPTRQVQCVGR